MPFVGRNVTVMAQFKKAGVNTAPSPAPTVAYIQAGGSATTGQTPTVVDATNFPGSYYYTLNAVTEGTYEANFHTTDTTVDQQDISVGFSVDPLPLLDTNIVLNKGTAQAGGASTITLANTASGIDGTYATDELIEITGGTGAGQVRAGASYVGSTKVLTVTPAWTTQPDGTSTYVITPGGGGASSDPWATTLPGAYTATQAGGILANVQTKANLIGQAGTTAISTGSVNGTLTLTAGMDYLAADGLGRVFTAPTGFPSFSGGSFAGAGLSLNGAAPIAGTILSATQLSFDVPRTVTATLGQGTYRVSVKLADGSIEYPETGQLKII